MHIFVSCNAFHCTTRTKQLSGCGFTLGHSPRRSPYTLVAWGGQAPCPDLSPSVPRLSCLRQYFPQVGAYACGLWRNCDCSNGHSNYCCSWNVYR